MPPILILPSIISWNPYFQKIIAENPRYFLLTWDFQQYFFRIVYVFEMFNSAEPDFTYTNFFWTPEPGVTYTNCVWIPTNPTLPTQTFLPLKITQIVKLLKNNRNCNIQNNQNN